MPNAVELKTGFLLTRAPSGPPRPLLFRNASPRGALASRPERGNTEPRYGPSKPMRGFSLSFGVDCLGLKRQERHRRCTELSSPSGGFHGKTSELNIDSQRKVPIRRETENEAARDSPDSQRSHHDAGRL